MRTAFVERTPLPVMTEVDRSLLGRLGQNCTDAAAARLDLQSVVQRRIFDLAPPEGTKLSNKLEEWWMLDFAAFRAEVKRVLRAEIPVKERTEWESYLASQAAEVRKLDTEIEGAEREIDAIVYRLFELAPDDVALIESSIAGEQRIRV